MEHTISQCDGHDDATLRNLGNGQARTRKLTDVLVNAALIFVVCLSILVYTLPIFSHELYTTRGVYNYGVVKAGTEVHHNFLLRNLHPWSVQVTRISSDCGCTRSFVGKTPPFRLAPLQAVTVSTIVKTLGAKGQKEQTVTVVTDDNSDGTHFIIRGEVQ